MKAYQNNIDKHQATIAKLTKDLNKLAILRLVAFIIPLIFITILANERELSLLWIIVPLWVVGFGLAVKRYNKLALLKQHAIFLKEINEQEVLRLENKLAGFPSGQNYIGKDHPYVSDLDIFGSHSLYQLLNRTTTESSNLLLAERLSEPASKEKILERQQAIKELTPKIDWRQHFQASGMHFRNAKSDYNKLLAWMEKPEQLLPHQLKYLIICISLALLSTSAAVYSSIQAFSGEYSSGIIPLVIILLVNFIILRRVSHIAEDIIDNTHENIKIIGGYQSLINAIESEQFHAAELCKLRSTFNQHNFSVVKEINKLRKILELSKLRGTRKSLSLNNLFYPFFNNFWLVDIYWILMTEKWKSRNKLYLKSWALAVSEFEVLSSLAGFAYSNPSYTFPEIKEEPYRIHFEMLGHPLISPETRVSNDFHINGRGQIAMVTGSNMAGKSTFLRTLGINLVLALMGAPCCAKTGQVSDMKIFTSMRTQDNLGEGVSSFYAELKRIEQLLKLIKSGEAIFFLLDEMFKGTNSQDRYKGGVSSIRQLCELNAFEMISTHDLELAKLVGKNMMVTNYSFNSEIRAGEMYFNYELTPGLCKDFNASELMKKSGIKILSNFEEI